MPATFEAVTIGCWTKTTSCVSDIAVVIDEYIMVTYTDIVVFPRVEKNEFMLRGEYPHDPTPLFGSGFPHVLVVAPEGVDKVKITVDGSATEDRLLLSSTTYLTRNSCLSYQR